VINGTYQFGGRTVNRVGFGAMQLTGRGAFGPPADRAEAVRTVRRAVNGGVDHIDTAAYYGPGVANEILREALGTIPENIAIVSKVGAVRDEAGNWLPAHHPDQLRPGVEDNLRALGVEQLHAVNLRLPGHGRTPADEPAPEEFDDQLAAMVALRDAGLIAGIGLSNVSLAQLQYASQDTDIVCVQNAYNLLDLGSQPLLELCAERGIAFVPFFPLGSAFSRGALLNHPVLREVATRLGATPAQVALAWVLAQAPHTLLIPGTSSVAHLEENLAAADVALDDEALAALATLASEQ
jgi:aryl-alcohol dehydrogenase-like predicted oxidoreductase